MKFKNKKVVYKNIQFDSMLERNTYRFLEMMKVQFTFHEDTFTLLEGYEIEDFSLKTKKLYKSKVRPMTYTPDFTLKAPNGTVIYVDSKGVKTPEFNLKWKLFRRQLKKNERAFITKTIADMDCIVDLFHIPKNIKQLKIDLKL